MKMNRLFSFFIIIIIVWSCNSDDGDDSETEFLESVLSLTDVSADNDAELQEYFRTHFYNYEEFANPPADFDFKIVIDTIAGDNADKRPLLDDVTFKTFTVSTGDFNTEIVEENDIPHKIYFLVAREGSNLNRPTLGDNTILRYEGSLLDGTVFDAATAPISFYPPNLIRGFAIGLAEFNTGSVITENGDGTLDFGIHGIGAVFMPSGLAYFFGTGPSGDLPQYANLIFKIDNLSFQVDTDFDGDGIPSIMEDLNGDGNLNNDNTDEDLESNSFVFIPNHVDPDDDGDGILTIDEIEINDDGTITFPDSDGDGVVDYLDSDS